VGNDGDALDDCKWGEFLMANYICTSSEITSLADAIRTKGGTSASLAWPSGFISAISAIPTGVSIDDIAKLASSVFSNLTTTTSFVASCAFYSNFRIQTLTLPNCDRISMYGFAFCSNLTTLNAPNLDTVESYAFY
jgi:hypothetical protein